MVKQKQQVISRFFAPKPKQPPSSPPPQPPKSPPPSSTSPKITSTVTFSPAKRLKTSEFISSNTPPSKKSKLSLQKKLLEPSNDVLEPSIEKSHVNLSERSKLSPSIPNSNPTLHQKFLQKLLEPSDEVLEPSPKNTHVGISGKVKYTPLEEQVIELKKKYNDVLLMVEVGYRFRFFGKDAEVAARVLSIYAHVDHNFLTASIPTFRLNVHVRRLVSQGYKVGVVKQTETASIKAHGSNRVGPFTRGLSALYTKATIEAAEDLGGGGGEEGCGEVNSYLCCVVEKEVGVEGNVGGFGVENGVEVRIGVVGVEISTGDVVYGEFNDGFLRSGLEAIVLSLSPAELILGEPLSKRTEKLLLAYAGPASNIRVERASRDCFKDGGALAELMTLFEDTTEGISEHKHDQDKNGEDASEVFRELAIKGIMDMPPLAVQALAITARHLKQFGLEKIFSHHASFRPYSSNSEMSISANTLQQLEILKNNSNGSDSGSLLQTMNHTLAIFGQRLLRHWVTHPLCDRNMITARLDAVAEIAESMGCSNANASASHQLLDDDDLDIAATRSDINKVLSSVLSTLGQSPDIQRGITRIFHKTATPSEFIAVVQAILTAAKQLQQLESRAVSSALLRNVIQTACSANLISYCTKLLSPLNKEAADKQDLLNLISSADGHFAEVSEARMKVEVANEKLESLICLYRKQLKMHKLDFMSVSGTTHLIELPSDSKVPSNWVKVNSTKKTVRYHPPEVLSALDQLSLASEELTIGCRAAWDKFLGDFAKHYAEFQAAVQALATLDCLRSLAILSRTKNYVRPVFVEDKEPAQIQIISGRHPVLENILEDNFVPNDTHLHGDKQFCQIVTGPNMGGKSCYIRQVALITIMAQVGSFVPASSAKLQVLDAVYTRMGASDNIHQGRSTFLEELSEASNILHHCTSRSLLILDELGRGTSTHDGVAIAYATLHHLLQQKRCLVLFVTHYPKIADIQKEFPGVVGSYHVSYLTTQENNHKSLECGQNETKMDQEDVTYLYKLVPGVSQRSFGFKVAQLAQLPPTCIQKAMVMSTELEALIQRRTAKNVKNNITEGYQGTDESDSSENTGLLVKGDSDRIAHLTLACFNFFPKLWSALEKDDAANCLELLKSAHIIATESTSERFVTSSIPPDPPSKINADEV
ncbi:DNA mismatch repair protein MSH3 isoform X1 [Silene latifolia]|uniref:DNA mismatch repair protein MSH3 isoform X1 n=2 Tax=Silene latifolia TaxID=37657 RepID=UPI003D7776F9